MAENRRGRAARGRWYRMSELTRTGRVLVTLVTFAAFVAFVEVPVQKHAAAPASG